MSRFTDEYCGAFADEVMAAAEPERLRKLWAMCETAVAENAPGFPIVLGIVLRGRFVFDWAEYVFQLASRVPGARGMALFELAVLEHMRGRPADSVRYLHLAEAEGPLNAYHQMHFAHVLARTGDRTAAAARLETAVRLDAGFSREAVEFRQFFDYLARFPEAEALRRSLALTEAFPVQTPAEVAQEVAEALRTGRPYAMIRLNDGEGAVLHHSVEDEAEFSALYARNRREWHAIWYGHEGLIADPGFLRAMAEFNAGIARADCVGAHHYWSLEGEYRWSSIRNVPCLFSVVRKLEAIRDGGAAGPIRLTNPQINQKFLFEGHLERLLADQQRLGLVSCHAALPDALKQRFGIGEVFLHRTPGEAAGAAGGRLESFEDWHGRLCAELRDVRPGVLYLVGAGVPGKIYCDLIKQGGGIALDIGAVADIWMNYASREYDRDLAPHTL